MIRFFIILGILSLLPFSGYSQLLNEEAEDTYVFIQERYNDFNYSDSVASFTYERLSSLGVKGDWLAYATVLVASANIDHNNDEKGYNEINKIDILSLTHLGTYYDVQLKKAQLLKNLDYLEKSDSLFERIVIDIPNNMPSLKAVAHNNYASVRKLLRDKNGWISNLDSANYYIDKIDPDSNLKTKRQNRNSTNLAKYFLSVDSLNAAKYYINEVDTTNAVLITKLEFLEMKSSIIEAEKDYETAMIITEEILMLTSPKIYEVFFENASEDYLRLETKIEQTKARQTKKVLQWIIQGLAVFLFVGYRVRKYLNRPNKITAKYS